MDKIFAGRFRSARVLSGLSLQELADKLNNRVSRQALHKYETGVVVPDSEMIALLSETLRVRPDFFFRDATITFGPIEFRKLESLPGKEVDRIIEAVKDRLSRYLELEGLMGISAKFDNVLSDFPQIENGNQAEAAAEELRAKWDLGSGPIFNVLELLESKHIKVIDIKGMHDGFDGMQTWVNGEIPVIAIDRDNLKSCDRLRFTALHELCHLLLKLNHLAEKDKERYCHRFAGALLLPKTVLNSELGAQRNNLSIQELGGIKRHYGISIQAIVMRAKDLGIITESYRRQFFFYMNQMGWKKVEPAEYIGEEASGRFEQLLFHALAEEVISIGKAAALSNETLSEFREKYSMRG
ncbi:MAG: XRE family transcriptional regulator [Puia sp.]|nr:XRE family transcriptional regulator [Puia sp.]